MNAATCAEPPRFPSGAIFRVADYDLASTLSSGQAFRWRRDRGGWEGVVDSRWVRVRQAVDGITAETTQPAGDWDWLLRYFRFDEDLEDVLDTFPDDEPMRAAVASCRGLRLLRQDPWECLASFICSSTKQIVQIQQIVAAVCERFGEPVDVPSGHAPAYSFPAPERVAAAGEAELRACKMGFRAPNLREAARMIAGSEMDLQRLAALPTAEARDQLMRLPGVGRKIADCVLLFGYGRQDAFPVDVWVMKALRQLYFFRRRVTPKRLREFAGSHFGPNAGYAQQYLFHYMRIHIGRKRGNLA